MNLKNKLFRLAVVLGFSLLATDFIYGATDANRNAIKDIYKIVAKALKEKDAKTIVAYETDDYSVKAASGKTRNRAEADAELKQGLAMFKTISNVEEQVTDVKIDNGTATVMVTETIMATFADPQGKDHAFNVAIKYRDIWVKIDEEWKIKYSEGLEDTSTLDGKPLHQ